MVSILLAAYNGERWLPEQLASLRAQTCDDFRVLWRDDGSTDGTEALLAAASREDARFTPAESQGEHLGAIGSFLTLMQEDDAPYTALCDQDDRWHADKLARCLAAMQAAEAQHGAEIPLLVHHDCRIVNAGGEVLHASFFRHQGWDGSAAALPSLLVQNNVTGCTCMMNAALRRLVRQHAQAERLYMHDWFIALTAAAFGHIIFVDGALADYRQHGTNVMGASRSSLTRRALSALAAPAKARERIALTYRHTRMFREAFGAALPAEAADVIDRYLAIEKLPKLCRIAALRRGGYWMQSTIARMGQRVFI